MSSVKYVDGYEAKVEPVKYEYGRNADGYGSKIGTDYMIRLKGKGERWRRVYAICYSNSASHYVIIKGERLYCRSFELETALGR